jgi:hypothetical protein
MRFPQGARDKLIDLFAKVSNTFDTVPRVCLALATFHSLRCRSVREIQQLSEGACDRA